MTVNELIALLSDVYDLEALVVMTSGDEYSPVANVWEGRYLADTTWSGEVYDNDDIDELEEDDDVGESAVVFVHTG